MKARSRQKKGEDVVYGPDMLRGHNNQSPGVGCIIQLYEFRVYRG